MDADGLWLPDGLALLDGDVLADGDWLGDWLVENDADRLGLRLGLTLLLATGTLMVIYGAGQGVPSALRPLPVVALMVMLYATSVSMMVCVATFTNADRLAVLAAQAMMRRASR